MLKNIITFKSFQNEFILFVLDKIVIICKDFINLHLIRKVLKTKFMYAIVEIAGQQLKVEKDQRYFINRLKEKKVKK